MKRKLTPFEKTGKWMFKRHRGKSDFFLVHGTIWCERRRRHDPHAWIEFAIQFKASRLMTQKDKGKKHVKTAVSMVYDKSLPRKLRIITKDSYYAVFRARPHKKYSKEQAERMLASYRHWGPWA